MSKSDVKHEPLDLPEGREYTHRAHRFPGKFHPPLVKHVLQEYGEDHDIIADPMCGSGTLGVEAAVQGRDGICTDLDPLSCLMTQAKTTPVPANNLKEVGEAIIDGVSEFPEENEVSEEYAREEVSANLDGTPFCVPINLLHWFEPYVAVGYSRLLLSAYEILPSVSDDMENSLKTGLAATVRQISRADPQPVSGLEVTSVRQEKLDKGIDFNVESSFRQALNRLADGYDEIDEHVDDLGEVSVHRENAKEFAEVCKNAGIEPSMVVTSPPYCNAIEYTRRHRLEYEWLGLFNEPEVDDPTEERRETSREFIGSTTPKQETLRNLPEVPHSDIQRVTAEIENENERKANLLRKYFLDAYDWVEQIYKVLPEGGLFCLIVGPSTSYGNTIDTPRYLTDIATDSEATDFSFEKVGERPYKLMNNKMQYPTDGATTDMEKLIRLKK
jgi:DNA modification methylase